MKQDLSEAQQRNLQFIKDFILLHGVPPTRDEMTAHFGWKSHNAAQCAVKVLEAKGHIVIRPMKSRCIEIVA